MSSGITEFVGELSRERWRSREANSDYVIAEVRSAVQSPATGLPSPTSENQSRDVVVLGNAPVGDFIPGLTYRFGGRWEEDRKDKYTGRVERQFKFTHYTKAEPHSRYGLVSYLAKFAPGIGPVIAGRLFDAFGTDAVKVLREFPESSGVVALLSLEKAKIASAALKRMGKMEDTKIELVGIFTGRGFPYSLTDACIKVWGVLAPTRIARDPFSLLVRRLPGCGFARCDRLYNDLGLPPGRLKRQMLCLWNALRTGNAGHTWFPAEHCKQTLEQSVSGVRVNFPRAVKLGLRSRWLAKRTDAGGNLWLAEFAKAENEQVVAEKLASLLNDPPTLTPFTSELDEATAERLSQIEDRTPAASTTHQTTDDAATSSPQAAWQLSSHRMTVAVIVSDGVIVDAAPVVRKFVGQSLVSLEMWMFRQGGFEKRPLNIGQQPESHAERLARRGRETGICQFCSRKLTHPTSLRLGYGPECGPKNGLPWVDDTSVGIDTEDWFSEVLESEAVNV